ncbi:XdhC family protein [Paenibacillus lemnae]|uniref:XdhC family protein n=1 Tax=Paenibacillus lemnae TaxID=1330551 RepID=A0A848M851_PAELE|nr:XdhC/CoxI family protein [Paenibacillus lemnae]NMO96391.1 XdhC family protein [Paenibacillus lemnae]
MKELLAALKRCKEDRLPCVIAAIIQVEGSSYRKEGARCIITSSGQVVGILSGGCIEEDIAAHASEVFLQGRPKKLVYDFRSGEDDLWGLGAGCNGAITVWLELFDPVQFPEAAASILEDYEDRDRCTVPYYACTVLDSNVPERYAPGERWKAAEGSKCGPFSLPPGSCGIVQGEIEGGIVEIFAERIQPVPRLTVIGAGADAELMTQMACMMGWHVSVAYHETARAVKENFPAAHELHHVPRGDFTRLPLHRRHYVLVMSHNLELDIAAAGQLLPHEDVVYMGILGSKSRINRIMEELQAEGLVNSRHLGKLHAPVGLNLGGETPQEITLSIMAEMVSHWHGASAQPMRTTKSAGLNGHVLPGRRKHG